MTTLDLLNELFAEERKRLAEITDCRGDYARPVFGAGNFSADVAFIGEAPGKDEALQGIPFVGKAGAQLDRMLSLAGIERSSIYITNSVKFRPYVITERNGRKTYRNRKPDRQEIKDGAALLAKETEAVSPKIIVTLGNTPITATEYVFGQKIGTIGDVHGKDVPLGNGITLVPLYHPASGIYNRELVKIMENDLIQLGKKLKDKEMQI